MNPNIRDDELAAIESNRQQVLGFGSGELATGCAASDRCDASINGARHDHGDLQSADGTPLVILYQDEHIMVVNKPSGLLSVPGRLEEHKDSVMTRVQRDHPQAESVHRLDMATSGVIVVALTKAAERELKRQFREREPKKQYIARIWGHPEKAEGLVDLPLICDWPNRPKQKVCFETGKAAQTEYVVLEYAPDNTARILLADYGRSHQLRVHMLALGHPILGIVFTQHRTRSHWRRVYSFMLKC